MVSRLRGNMGSSSCFAPKRLNVAVCPSKKTALHFDREWTLEVQLTGPPSQSASPQYVRMVGFPLVTSEPITPSMKAVLAVGFLNRESFSIR